MGIGNGVTNYSGGFPGGLTVRGVSVAVAHPGNLFWVDSGAGSDVTGNGTFETPFATVNYALDQCTASNGDILLLKPGHAETIAAAAGIALDVIGVAVIGLGTGALRPTFNFTATTSTMTITAANVTVANCLFTGGVDVIVTQLVISAADCAIISCETKDVTGQMETAITTTAAADRLLIDGYTHRGATAAGGVNCLEIVGGDGITVKNFWIDGNFSVSAIENVTTASTNLSIYGETPCFVRIRNAADVAITCVATSTGNLGPNIYVRVLDHAANITEAIVGADMQLFQPIAICNLDGEVGMNTNITASTDA